MAGWGILCLCSLADLGNQSYAPPGRLIPVALTAMALFLQHEIRRGYRIPTPGPVEHS
jgi:hypothetical protein